MRKEWDMFEGMFEFFSFGYILSTFTTTFAFIYMIIEPSIKTFTIMILLAIFGAICCLAWDDLNRFRIWCFVNG
jgi:hypothetical protein